MKIVRVQHVSVNCHGNLDATRRFYTDLFELPDIPRPDIPGIDGSWLGLGDVQLHLVDAAQSGDSPDPVAPHWCLWVADIDAARAELYEKTAPHARVVRIANASHYIWRSNEAQVEQEMNAFMDGLQ